MQELQILPYDQCFAAFGGFPDSDTKQNSGSTVRKYSITNAYSVSPCSTSTDIDCRSGWRFFLVWRIFTYTGGRGKKGNRWWRGRGEERENPHCVLPSPSPSFFSRFDLGSAFARLYLSHFTNLKRKHTEKELPATQATTDMTLNCESKRTHSADSPRERGELPY